MPRRQQQQGGPHWPIFIIIGLFVALILDKGDQKISYLGFCEKYRVSKNEYRDFIPIDENGINDFLELKFFVMAKMQAHILLSPDNDPNTSSPSYEIVIGAGENTYSELRYRTHDGDTRVAIHNSPAPLSDLDPFEITVTQEKYGTILVGIDNDAFYLEYKDPDPIHIKYLSFKTHNNVPSRWFYNCYESESQKSDLFKTESSHKVPNNLENINLKIGLKNVAYDSASSILTTRVVINLKWIDQSSRWSPKEVIYGKINKSTKESYPFWIPSLMVLNGTDEQIDLTSFYKAFISQDGVNELISKEIPIKTRCDKTTEDWPDDMLDCQITLGLNEKNLYLKYDHTVPIDIDEVSLPFAWKLQDVPVSSTIETSTYKSRQTDMNLIIKVKLQRNGDLYRKMLYTPLVVAILILLAFYLQWNIRRALILLGLLVIISQPNNEAKVQNFGKWFNSNNNYYVICLVLCYCGASSMRNTFKILQGFY